MTISFLNLIVNIITNIMDSIFTDNTSEYFNNIIYILLINISLKNDFDIDIQENNYIDINFTLTSRTTSTPSSTLTLARSLTFRTSSPSLSLTFS